MNYGWLLLRAEGGNISITQANRREATNRVHSFFHFSSPLGPRMLFESSVTHSSLLTVIFPTSAAKPSFYRTYELCIEGLIYVQLMLWFQHSYVTAGTEP